MLFLFPGLDLGFGREELVDVVQCAQAGTGDDLELLQVEHQLPDAGIVFRTRGVVERFVRLPVQHAAQVHDEHLAFGLGYG